MQPPPTWSSNSSGGGEGGGAGRGGLSRFRSAPATWLEELLEGEEEDPLKSNHSLTQLLVGSTPPSSRSLVVPLSTAAAAASSSSCSSHGPGFLDPGGRFQRQNSSPADFLGSSRLGSDGYFSSFGLSNNYELISSDIDVYPRRVSFSLEGERSRQVDGAESGLMDMEVEKLLEDSVPCRVRAKRGCATHPRSIAERVRRTRISDRIRKLQELVPNMDQQTNTADMLDEAVEYVKFLQKQIQELLEHQSKCTCVSKE